MSRIGAWIIDFDYLDNRVPNVRGPRTASDEALAILGKARGKHNARTNDPSMVKRFRMFDDDGELYYSGRAYLPAECADSDEFGPLDDYGTPNAGATDLQYYEGGEWVSL